MKLLLVLGIIVSNLTTISGAYAYETIMKDSLQCSDSEALLKVSYSIDQEGWNNLYAKNDTLRFDPTLTVRPSGNIGNSTDSTSLDYGSFQDVKDFEMCVPRVGACLELTVGIFPKDTYNITFDDKAVDVGQSFSYWERYEITTTEIGNYCTPQCEDSEALFEFNQWTGQNYFDAWRVEDMNGNKVLGCDDMYGCDTTFFQMYTYRACLPRDTCHRFLIGGSWQWVQDYHLVDAPSFTVKYDGNELLKSDSWLFDTITFGGENCQSSPCDSETESTIQFFMSSPSATSDDNRSCSFNPDLHWEVDLYNDTTSASSQNGIIPGCNANSTLFFETICVPKDACTSFFISPSSNATRPPSSAAIQLSMDDIVYRKTRLSSDWDSNEIREKTTHMGKCTVDDLCLKDSEALFQVDLETPTTYNDLSAIPSNSVDWRLGYIDEDLRDQGYGMILNSWSYVDTYELGVNYRTIECVPKEECSLEFNMTSNSPVEEYTVQRNGVSLGKPVKKPDTFYSSQMIDVTVFGKDCNVMTGSSSLSGGAIAGIVIASVFAILLIILAILWFVRRDKSTEPVAIKEPLIGEIIGEENL